MPTRAPSAIVVVDEAYVDFALGAGIDASMLPYLGQHPNLVVLRTISKSYSLAGARLGLLFAAAPLVAELMKVKDSYNVNAVTQALGVAALEDRSYHEEAMRRTLDQRARLETRAGDDRLDVARIGGEFPAVSRSATAPRPSTARSRRRACWCAGGGRPSCARSCGSASAIPTRTTT